MTSTATERAGTSLEMRLEAFVRELLDRAQEEARRGNLAGSVTRRVVARDLQELLLDWAEGGE